MTQETVQLSVAQQIWEILQKQVAVIARVFGLQDEKIYDVVIDGYIAEFYNLKSAS